MKTHAEWLTARWRVLYTVGTVVALLTAGYGSSGSVGLALGSGRATFAIPGIALAVFILGRLVWVWRRPDLLTWPAGTWWRGVAKVALVASVVGVAGFLARIISGRLMSGLEPDVRGAVGLVVGLYMLPFIALGPWGVVVFEWARGISARREVATADRALLAFALVIGAALVITPPVSSALFPSSSLTRSQYDGVLPWVAFALGLAAPIMRGVRVGPFPASAAFAATLTAYFVGAWLMAFLWPQRAGQLFLGGGPLVNGAGFALVLAMVPAAALALVDGLSKARSRSWAARALLAVPLALAVAWLGVATRTKALQPVPRYTRERVLSDEQLAAQAEHLRRRCPDAGPQILRTQSDVTELEVRYPDEQGRKPAPLLDYASFRSHDWFPRPDTAPSYELVVVTRNGERIAYGLEARAAFGYTSFPEKASVHPRYVLTWSSIQTAQEETDGVIGNEMSIIDTQDNSVLARRVLFFSRTNERSGIFWEACGTRSGYPLDSYVHEWVRTVLIPKPR